jgi:WD40 repeat protein
VVGPGDTLIVADTASKAEQGAVSALPGTAVVWDLNSGKRREPPLVHGEEVIAVALCLDGKTALTIGRPTVGRLQPNEDATVMRWDIASGNRIAGPWKLPFHRGFPFRMTLALDGETVLFHGPGGVHRLSLASGESAGKVLQRPGYSTVELDDQGRYAAIANFDRVDLLKLPRWDRELHALQFRARVAAMAFAPDGGKLFTGSLDGQCRLWDPATGKPAGELAFRGGYPRKVAFAPDGKALLLCNSQGKSRLWDPDTGQPLGPELGASLGMRAAPTGSVMHPAFNKAGSHFLLQTETATHVLPTPVPVTGTVERLVLWAQVLTGLELVTLHRVAPGGKMVTERAARPEHR